MQEAISVTRYNNYIKQIFDAEEFLHGIDIVGEVFGVSFSRQVTYFSLKDESSSISCVCFYPQIAPSIKEGDLVIITGSPSYYQKSGKLNFNVVDVKPAGQGILFQKFLELKEKLEANGIFAKEHKIEIPKNIKRIGVITSKEGAVIRDIINVSSRRDPSVDIVLFPCKVQGNGAEKEIAYAIEKMDEQADVDVIVVARGGGSLEDLWAYNTEVVAMATYNAKKPIISAVGHETDFTIIDFVSDLRAPTPSAAAELLTKDISEENNFLKLKIMNLKKGIENYLSEKQDEVISDFESLCNTILLKNMQEEKRLHKNILTLKNSTENYYNNAVYNLDILNNTLNQLSPASMFNKGYVKVEQNGNIVDNLKDIVLSSDIRVYFKDGSVIATPKKKES